RDLRDQIEPLLRVAVGTEPLLLDADLHQELAVLRELQEMAVVPVAVAADPDVALAVDLQAVVRRRPLIALAVLAAEMTEKLAVLIELHDRRRLLAARAGALVGRGFHGIERVGAVNDPDVIAGVDADANRLSEIPAVRQRLRPHRIDFEARRLHGAVGLRGDALFEEHLPDAKPREQRDERASDNEMTFHDALRCRDREDAKTRRTHEDLFSLCDPRDKDSS